MPKISEYLEETTPSGTEEVVVNDGGNARRVSLTNALGIGTPKLVPGSGGVARVNAPVRKDNVSGVQLDDDTIIDSTPNATPKVIHTTTMVDARYYAIRGLVTAVSSNGALCAEFVVEAGYKVTGGVVSQHHKTISEKGTSGYTLALDISGMTVTWTATGGATPLTWQVHFHTQMGASV